MNSAEPNEEGGMALVTLELSSTTEVSSAQQHVRVVVVSLIRVRLRFDGRDELSGDGDDDGDDDGVDARHASISFPMRWSQGGDDRRYVGDRWPTSSSAACLRAHARRPPPRQE